MLRFILNLDTMIYQVQEMLYIERGGIEQMKDEIKLITLWYQKVRN